MLKEIAKSVIAAGGAMGAVKFGSSYIENMAPSEFKDFIKPMLSAALGYAGIKFIPDVALKTGVVVGSGLMGTVTALKMAGVDLSPYVPLTAGEAELMTPPQSATDALAGVVASYPELAGVLRIARPMNQSAQVPALAGYDYNPQPGSDENWGAYE